MYCDVHDLCYTTSCPIGQAATGVAREAKRLWKLQRRTSPFFGPESMYFFYLFCVGLTYSTIFTLKRPRSYKLVYCILSSHLIKGYITINPSYARP